MDLTTLGRILLEGREGMGMSRAELARRLGVTSHYVWQIEHGNDRSERRSIRPSATLLEQWSTTLGWDSVATEQLLILAGHRESNLDNVLGPQFFTGFGFPKPRELERREIVERVLQILKESQDLPDDAWRENIQRLKTMIELIEFSLHHRDEQ